MTDGTLTSLVAEMRAAIADGGRESRLVRNIVAIYEIWLWDAVAWIAMEQVEGLDGTRIDSRLPGAENPVK